MSSTRCLLRYRPYRFGNAAGVIIEIKAMEIPWLNAWLDDPDHTIELMMAAVGVLGWIVAQFLGITRDDFQGYWERRDDSGFDDE